MMRFLMVFSRGARRATEADELAIIDINLSLKGGFRWGEGGWWRAFMVARGWRDSAYH